MSTRSKLFIGLTLELGTNLSSADFKKLHAIEEKYPELDEYNYEPKDREGKILLIYDGMNGDFARLVWPDKVIEPGMLGEGNEFIESYIPSPMSDPDIGTKITTLVELYEEFTGEPCGRERVKYAMWSQWF